MTKEIEGQTLRDYGIRKKRYRRIRTFIICILLLAIVVVGAFYWARISNRNYQSYEVVNNIPNTGEKAAGYLSYGSAVVKYNRDGAVAIENNGNLKWNGSYEMLDPIAETCGNYVVIADRGNKKIYIFNGKGFVSSITTLHNIIRVGISAQGVVVALMEEKDTNYIKFYYADKSVTSSKEEDNLLTEIVKSVSEVGYPIDIALSEDGEKLIISFLSITSGEMVSTIGFYNFGEVGQSYIDRFVGGYKYDGIIIPRVTFLNNDVACIFKENGILIYSYPEKPKFIYEENFENKIQSVFYSSKYAGVVLEGMEGTTSQLLLYDLKGTKVLDKELDFRYDKILLSGEDIIMYNNLSCIIMKTNGSEKFRYTFNTNISAFYPINNLDRYFLVNATEISEILLLE